MISWTCLAEHTQSILPISDCVNFLLLFIYSKRTDNKINSNIDKRGKPITIMYMTLNLWMGCWIGEQQWNLSVCPLFNRRIVYIMLSILMEVLISNNFDGSAFRWLSQLDEIGNRKPLIPINMFNMGLSNLSLSFSLTFTRSLRVPLAASPSPKQYKHAQINGRIEFMY